MELLNLILLKSFSMIQILNPNEVINDLIIF